MRDWSAHLSTLFTEHPALERPGLAADAGFAFVETWWPPAAEPMAWATAAREAGVRAALVNADGGDLAAGERGYCNRIGRRSEVVAAAAAAAEVAVAAGGSAVNLLVGRVEPDVPVDDQLLTARDAVRAAADAVAAIGGRLVIEHLNAVDVDAPLLGTPEDAADFVRAVDHPAVTLLFDAYHAAMAGLDPLAELARVLPLVGHVQYADAPGRGAPGTGTVDLAAVRDLLRDAGYDGPVGLEFAPGALGTAAALARLPA